MSAAAQDRATEEPAPHFTGQELARFERDGYLIVRQLGTTALCSRMLNVSREELAKAVGPLEYEADVHYPGAPPSRDAEGGRTVRRLQQALSRDPCFVEWIASRPLANRLHQLLGPHVAVPLAHHNCIMTKQPRFSSDTGWHQDIRYWSFERPELISVWLALTPENLQNGCLHLIPGTHASTFDRQRYDDASFLRDDLPENRALIAKATPAELLPGDALFFHCRTFHAASRNHSDTTKLSVVFTFRALDNPPIAGTRSASLPELLLPTG